MLSIYNMKSVHYRYLFALWLAGFFCQVFLPLSEAQITLDGSLGPKGPLAGPHYEIAAEMGQIRGKNLFHSFGQFNVLTGESATFTGPTSVAYIFSRVTGGNPSIIDGLLQADIPGASLYFLNPSGVLFGPNAQLNISGAFHVSTANVIRFSDGAIFAADLTAKSTLTVAAPVTFGFLDSNPAGIMIQGSQLSVQAGQTFSVTGGEITITASPEAMGQSPTLEAPSGRLYLTSVASPGEVHIESVDYTSRLLTDRPARLGTVLITDGALMLVSGEQGGSILVEAGHITLAQQATLENITTGAGPSGDIVLKSDILTLGTGAAIFAATDPGTSGNAGHVRVDAQSVAIRDGAVISNFTLGTGRGGDITLRAAILTIEGFNSQIVSATEGGTGNAGHVRVDAQNVTVTNGAVIGNGTFGTGDGGDITVIAQGAVTVDGFGVGTLEGQGVIHQPSLITTSAQQGSTGNAGRVRVEAQRVTVSNGAQIQSGTDGQGRGGDLTIIAQDALTVDGFGGGVLSLITASSLRGPTGNAGNVWVEAQTVTATNGAQISSGTFGTGQGGSVTVIARDSVTFRGTSPEGEVLQGVLFPGETTFASGASVASLDVGAPGMLQVTAPRVILAEGGGISALNVASQGVGGTVTVHVADALTISGAGSSISTASLGPGEGGKIALHAGAITLASGARITAESTGTGNAGNIAITTQDRFLSTGGSVVTRATQADGGNITITAPTLVRLRDSAITADVGGGVTTVGGNITIDPQFVLLQNSRIVANAFQGRGGNIQIRAQQVFLADPTSRVDASSERGIDGEVAIQAPVTSISGSVAPLPQTFARQHDLLRERCAERARAGAVSRLLLGGRDGVPWQPGNWLTSPLEPLPLLHSTGHLRMTPERPSEGVDVLSINNARQVEVRALYAQRLGAETWDVACAQWLGKQPSMGRGRH